MNAAPPPAPLAPVADALAQRIEAELKRPAALMAPAGLRQLVQQLAALVREMARRLDHLETGN